MRQIKEDKFSEACREHLKENFKRKMNRLISDILSFIEIGYGGNDNRYRMVRSKVLTLINDELRNVSKELDEYVIVKKVFKQEMPFIGKE
jgi:hypothetical protein